MSPWSFRSRAAWIMPIVLLLVALLEEVATYKVRQKVANVYLRAAIVLLLNAFAFTLAAAFVAPRLKDALAGLRKRSHRSGGDLGLWLFYVLAYGALFLAYLTVERHGVAHLLPAALR